MNVVISNVPGPQVPLYLAGAKMTGLNPLSIVVHGVALNITVQSYLGQLCVGIIACRRALPDVAELAQQFGLALETLRSLPLPVAQAAAETAPAVAPQRARRVVRKTVTKASAPTAKKASKKPRLAIVEPAASPPARPAARRRPAKAA